MKKNGEEIPIAKLDLVDFLDALESGKGAIIYSGKIGNSIIEAHLHSLNNKNSITSDEKCGCFHCLETFSSKEIKEWIWEKDGNGTALCPFCTIDSVLGESSGFPINDEFLRAMKKYWFETLVESVPISINR